jgi:DNA-binding transcriptional ArsR family regulator
MVAAARAALASALVIRIELTEADLGRTRLALSPLWELVASLFWLHRDEPSPEYAPWIGRARNALRGVDLGPLDLSIQLPQYVPDFAAPIPTDPLPTLAAEIEAVRSTDPAVVRADIVEYFGDDPPPPWNAFLGRPAEMVDRLADAMNTYWDATIADDWPRLRAVLEGEMLGRARELALSGPTAVLEELHPSLRWRAPVIELYKEKNFEMHLEGRPLVLMPLVFARNVLMGVSEGQRAVAIGYQARGTSALWAPNELDDDDARLDLLLGHGRATVLRALDQPATTTELARRLSYAPSTVSAHLDVLARAGLVDRHRVRRSVFYGLNATGESLVALLADIPEVLSA